MNGARKSAPPDEFLNWKAKASDDWQPKYRNMDANVRKALINTLYHEQRGLCVYCGRKLDQDRPGKSFHIEHFRPQKTYPCHQIEHQNLFLSCGHEEDGNRSEVCGTKKDNWFDENCHVPPFYPDASLRFEFKLNGNTEPKTSNDSPAIKMIEILNLNHDEIKRGRKELFLALDTSKIDLSDLFDVNSQTGSSYAHIAYQRENETLP